MKSNKLHSLLAFAAAATWILAFVAVPGLFNKTQDTATTLLPSAADEPSEGIQVHGQWRIEVRNPDGALVEKREFNNALQPNGERFLASLLGRQGSVGGYLVRLSGSPTSTGAFASSSGVRTQGGVISESSYSRPLASESYLFKNLVVSAPVPASADTGNKTVLTGYATANVDGNITNVSVEIEMLLPSDPPGSVYGGYGSYLFTRTAISPVNLTSGQTVTVTVEFSFS